MAETTTEYVSAINDVIAVCRDAEEGFRGAAKEVEDDPTLQNTFEEYSKQRANFAKELESALRDAGGEPVEPGGLAGKLHSAWMSVKGTLTGHSAHQILVETERGEDLSVQRYREALDKTPPAALRTVLQEQYEQVQLAHTHLRNLRDRTE